jgi:hypothetical protein
MITHKSLEDLIATTLQDLPLPRVVDLLSCSDADSQDSILTFVKTHYSEEEIKIGIDEFLGRIDFINRLFSGYER